MGKMGDVNARELKAFEEKLKKLGTTQRDQFMRACAKELAARLLTKVIKRTPVGVYPSNSGKTGGTLRRGWTADSQAEAEGGGGKSAQAYADSLKVKKAGGVYTIEVTNPVEYASYVEYGHRTRNHKGFVKGYNMLTISEDELRTIAPKVLERKLQTYLGDVFK